jgi:uncharacterized protein (TIGR03382 family)
MMPVAGEFWGVIAAERITQIHFGLDSGGFTQSGDFRIDDLTIGNQDFPEESCDGAPLDISSLVPGSGDTVTQEGSTENALDDIAETDEVACWMGEGAAEHVYRIEVPRAALLQIDLGGSGYDTKLAVVDGCPAGEVLCRFDDDGDGLQSALDCAQYDAGSYSIIVSGSGAVGEYKLHVRDCGAPCGDAMVNGAEECDDGEESATCDADCTSVACGDDVTNATAGEECDDGNTEDGDGCSAACTVEAADSTGGGSEGGATNTDSTVDGGDVGSASITTTLGDGGLDSEGSSGSSGGSSGLDDRSSCGCTTRSSGSYAAWMLLALFVVRRRRH